MSANPAASEDTSSEMTKPMRILPQYLQYCPDCHNGRTKIAGPASPYTDRVPCPTCRPEDNKAELRKRSKEGAK